MHIKKNVYTTPSRTIYICYTMMYINSIYSFLCNIIYSKELIDRFESLYYWKQGEKCIYYKKNLPVIVTAVHTVFDYE